ncbi:hypothetical protein SAMN04487770_11149 [Butyrivibrio sp. ob235]|uniref:hypothetical protein n=1 Tax=Butyrivibrio sp. ob235 TaxID=1761780 RepID=UPI0008D0FE7F|nr:hypothetical protein [Butyrivibrio sp. ob235]SEL49614.1 hypothetical protein SAMN04487770_11149 [Butyrivibrio sp. ob235]
MMELTGIKEQNGIYTYSYNVTPDKVSSNANSAQIETNKIQQSKQTSQINTANTQSFEDCYNNAADTIQKTSKSDYSKAEWDAQRTKNTAIGKLQKLDADVAALERVAPNAPQEVKSAWIDASRETGFNGMGYGESGATKLFAEVSASARMTDNSIAGVQDLFGGTVDSAIDAVSAARYDTINNSANGNSKELEFYDNLLGKLNGLKDGSYTPSDVSTFEKMNKNNIDVYPGEESKAVEKLELPDNYGQGYFFHRAAAYDAEGNSFELSAKYPADYDKTNPSVEVYVKQGDQEGLYKVEVNKVNPETAGQAELYGLFAYIEDDKNVPRNIDPDSSDLYYSELDKKLEKLKSDNFTQIDTQEMVNTFKSMDTLSYWDKIDLRKSLMEIM